MSISLLFDSWKERGVVPVRSRSLFCPGSQWCSSWSLPGEQLLASVEVLQGKPELSTVVRAGSFMWQGHFSCTSGHGGQERHFGWGWGKGHWGHIGAAASTCPSAAASEGSGNLQSLSLPSVLHRKLGLDSKGTKEYEKLFRIAQHH